MNFFCLIRVKGHGWDKMRLTHWKFYVRISDRLSKCALNIYASSLPKNFNSTLKNLCRRLTLPLNWFTFFLLRLLRSCCCFSCHYDFILFYFISNVISNNNNVTTDSLTYLHISVEIRAHSPAVHHVLHAPIPDRLWLLLLLLNHPANRYTCCLLNRITSSIFWSVFFEVVVVVVVVIFVYFCWCFFICVK